jgi:hypothetical protein
MNQAPMAKNLNSVGKKTSAGGVNIKAIRLKQKTKQDFW